MEIIKKKPYEISLWKDELQVDSIPQYYEEVKLATIGSDTMDSPIRAFEPILTSNIDGSKSLTFSIYMKYFDEEEGAFKQNSFLKLLVNERKVKLRYADAWYDFIIKNIEEDPINNVCIYTAQDLHVNELSKVGFNIELDIELRNNQGSVLELAEKVFENTDWKVIDSGEKFLEFLEEPLYEMTLNSNIVAIDMENHANTLSIAAGEQVYVFYSTIAEEDEFFQFLYCPVPDNSEDERYLIDDNLIIINSPNYYIDQKVTYQGSLPSVASNLSICHDMRGSKLIRKQKTEFDPVLNRLVNVYKDENDEVIYGYRKLTILDSRLMQNIITNGESPNTLNGWIPAPGVSIKNQIFPEITSNTDLSLMFSQMLVTDFEDNTSLLYNNGFSKSLSFIKNIAKGEKYVFNIRHGIENSETSLIQPTVNKGLRAVLAEYEIDSLTGEYKIKEVDEEPQIIFDFSNNFNLSGNIALKNGYKLQEQYIIAEANKSFTEEELTSKQIGIFIYNSGDAAEKYYIETIEIFPYIEDKSDESKPFLHYTNLSYLIPNIDTYYYYKKDNTIKEAKDIIYLYKGIEASDNYAPVYSEDFQKIRSITARESNVYNLSQELCEIFECWTSFNVQYEDNGKIKLILEEDEDGVLSYRKDKTVSFHHYPGKQNDVGFRYGINLSSIQRTLDSDSIVTKLIVKPNSNAFAPNGFCAIARAGANPTRQNSLLSFKYYINQGLLKFEEVSRDFYETTDGYLGYYTQLFDQNFEVNKKIEELTQLNTNLMNEQANFQTQELLLLEASQELLKIRNELRNYTGYTYEEIKEGEEDSPARGTLENPSVYRMMVSIKTLNETIRKTQEPKETSEANLNGIKSKIEEIQEDLEELIENNRVIEKAFYKKYSSYIQEGAWTSEDYIDDDLYYLDAMNVLNTSVVPQVTYIINVLELSQLEGYENYSFALGDKTYIEDTDFFGWVEKRGLKTPYREEVIVSEISYSLDSPEKNEVTIQNYKTRFEDLFQRITAATQSVEYAKGEYEKTTKILTTNGTIKPQILEDSFSNNAIILENASDQSVTWDETGITVSNLLKPNEIVRLVNGGIFLTEDQGETWVTGVTAKGINTEHLTSGQIDAGRINILSGEYPAFRWDDKGISAYEFGRNNYGVPQWFNLKKYVRFDQYGIYGMEGSDEFIPQDEEHIKENANFSLTWSGFQLKSSNRDGGYLSIDSGEDLQIFKTLPDLSIRRVLQLGRLGSSDNFGIELYDSNHQAVFSAKDDATLFIGDANQYLKWENNKLFIKGDIEMSANSIISWSNIVDAEIEATAITNNTLQTTNVTASNLKVAAANVTGTLTASQINFNGATGTNVNLTGKITATSGSFDGSIVGGSININDTFTVNSSGRFVATSGSVGGWEVGPHVMMAENTFLYGSGTYAGSFTVGGNIHSAPFRVGSTGNLFVGDATDYLTWDATNGLVVSGSISGGSSINIDNNIYVGNDIYLGSFNSNDTKRVVFNSGGSISCDLFDLKLFGTNIFLNAWQGIALTVQSLEYVWINNKRILTEADLGEYADGGTIPVRGSTGAIAVPAPTHYLHAVNLQYLEANYVKK